MKLYRITPEGHGPTSLIIGELIRTSDGSEFVMGDNPKHAFSPHWIEPITDYQWFKTPEEAEDDRLELEYKKYEFKVETIKSLIKQHYSNFGK
jgi:hypothetical protein